MRALAALLLLLATPAPAQADLGPAGLFSGANKEDLPPVTLSAGEPLAAAPRVLKSARDHEVEIEGDGSAELGLTGAAVFRAIWIDEIVVEGLEIRPMALDPVEFDEAGTMEIGFIAIRPGTDSLSVPGSTGDSPRLDITIE